MKNLRILSICLLTTYSAFGDSPPSPKSPLPMPTQQVLDRIKRVTALDTLSPVADTQRVALSEVNIPFLGSQIRNQEGIRVRLAPVKIKWPAGYSLVEDPYTRHITIYLGSEARNVLAINCRLAERPADIREASAEETERQLSRLANEVYTSFPNDPPKHTFMEVLKSRDHSRAAPQLAREIDAVYVMYSRMKQESYPAWVITYRGLPPFTVRNPMRKEGEVSIQTPVWRRDLWRNIFNANTGEWITGSNLPKPGLLVAGERKGH